LLLPLPQDIYPCSVVKEEIPIACPTVANITKQVKPEHYQLFDLFVVQKWPVRKITQTLGVSVGQVYLAKHRISSLLKKEIARLEKETIWPGS